MTENEKRKMKIIECPRDAMQGLSDLIPTEKKIKYINKLLKVGFDTIDFGSFVSPRAIPQLADTTEVLKNLDLSETKTKLLAIVANLRGARNACSHQEISYLGFPLSISESFQKLNINATIKESLGRVEDINVVNNICHSNGKKLVVYLSMAFGNPYGDEWSLDLISKSIENLKNLNIEIIALSDTVGISSSELIHNMFTRFKVEFPGIEFGGHFHTTAATWQEKINAAYEAGCTRFDGAIKGYGGCPMSGYHLVGNMPTENIISFFDKKEIKLNLDMDMFNDALMEAKSVFP